MSKLDIRDLAVSSFETGSDYELPTNPTHPTPATFCRICPPYEEEPGTADVPQN